MNQHQKPIGLFGPQLEPHLDRVFAPLCAILSQVDVSDLQRAVTQHVGAIRTAMSRNEFLDIDTAERIAGVLIGLLKNHHRYEVAQRPLIVGAARYFIEANDVDPDTGSLLGFDDDVIVLNFVLDRIGRSDLRVEL
jgi:uncharacterized membrane protein YkvA (DUF1232 family)